MIEFLPRERRPHRVFGEVDYWISTNGQFRVERFPEGSGRFIAVAVLDGRTQLISTHRKLSAAKRACRPIRIDPTVGEYVKPRKKRKVGYDS